MDCTIPTNLGYQIAPAILGHQIYEFHLPFSPSDDLQRPLADIDVFQASGAGFQRRVCAVCTSVLCSFARLPQTRIAPPEFVARGAFAAVMIDGLLPILVVAGGECVAFVGLTNHWYTAR